MSEKEILRRHEEAIDFFTTTVRAVRDDQWHAPTPCTEWSVRELVNHLTVEQLWVPDLVLDGSTIADVGDAYDGDQLGDDPVGAWDRASAASYEAFRIPGALERTVHLSYGDTSASAYCAQMTTDAAVHAWDLARAIGADEKMPEGLAAACLREVEPYAKGLSSSGLFEQPVKPPAGADDQTKLLCLLGRRP
ncbi:TIGR03086 family metal-binding protein [Streptantibioticus rubrisoli]|uniref:TIGR03086 family metal-binding protein n=1 Tax=Streptantibioticus rubrisoli TaxID=1387313 RepID=A0ABT1P5I8_9ACTN|nr:TIGR03086 family metal-binding protein [Streptantibioticus rubrisoli]MCQ4040631.1 TIGR03086 family metal-binding protein [Streptantibioticus rubrisoli]